MVSPAAPEPVIDAELDAKTEEVFGSKPVAVDNFTDLVAHLAKVHPSRYRQLIDGLEGIAWRNVQPITEQAVALRFVVLADRLYDKDLPIVSSGVPFDQVFTPEMLAGGYQKKYFRAVSRLTALARERSAWRNRTISPFPPSLIRPSASARNRADT